MFGIPYIGADICGFMLNTTNELCTRWMQLGAFYTFSRNHNGIGNIPQDPAALGEDVAAMSQMALRARYLLLPYLYTLFHKSHTLGNTVLRPLHHEFPRDKMALGIDRQFMWGPALLISPILEKGQTQLSIYFPASTWYDFYTGESLSDTGGETVTILVGPQTHIPLHLRGGHVLPFQYPGNNTSNSRKNPIQLMITLDKAGQASGDFFWDDGESVDTYENGQYLYATFNVDQNRLSVAVLHDALPSSEKLFFGGFTVCGIQSTAVTKVVINDVVLVNTDYNYNISSKVLLVFTNISLSGNITATWTLSDGSENVDCIPDVYNRKEKFSSDSKTTCLSRGCIWSTENLNLNNGPSPCFLRPEIGYEWTRIEDIPRGKRYHLQKMGSSSMFQNDFKNIYLDIEEYSNDLIRLKFNTAEDQRYEVPMELNLPEVEISDPRYVFTVTNFRPFNFQITRLSTGTVIWDTSVGGMVFSDQFLQIATRLPSRNVYGFGENNHVSFRHDLNYQQWGLFARDQPPGWGDHLNLYGVHPFYTCVENDGNTHGVFLLNSNAQDYSLSPLPMLTYRTIGGIFDFFFFLGPDPESVVQQYTGMIGRPVMPPYWALGFQISRYNYTGTADVRATIERTRKAMIPQDVQYVDIDYMNKRVDFTVDDVNFAGLNDYFKEIQSKGMRTVVILDPCIISNWSDYEPYEKFKQAGANVKWPADATPPYGSVDDDRSVLGYVWPQGKVIFPDFFRNVSRQTWIDLIVKFRDTVSFDGLWIDMNEPANFGTNEERPVNWPPEVKPYWSLKCYGNKFDNPPYKTFATYTHNTEERAATFPDKTLCMTVRQGENGEYLHYNVHNLYGWSQTLPTLQAAQKVTGERSIVVTRSTFPGSGRYAGHWLGDNDSTWEQLRASVIGIMEFNLFGIPYIGADICGFWKIPTREMCYRWMQLGAFYTFSRNHNGEENPPQDPAYFDEEFQEMSRDTLNVRYSLLPYLYTLFYNAHVFGNTVIRPVHHEFPTDPNTWSLSLQFMWGRSLLICPIVYEGQTELKLYLPKARWYDFYTGHLISEEGGDNITLSVNAKTKIPLFSRGGSIVPQQQPANNTHFSRQNPISFVVMLDRLDDDGGTAYGELFWDDGVSIDTIENNKYYRSKLYSEQQSLDMLVQQSSPTVAGMIISTITISGVNNSVDRVTIRTTNIIVEHKSFVYNSSYKVLSLDNLSLKLEEDFHIQWSHGKTKGRSKRQAGGVPAERIDCIPDNNKHQGTLENECRKRQCIWNADLSHYELPFCYIDNHKYGYTLTKATPTATGMRFDLRKRSTVTMFGDDSDVLQLNFERWSDTTFRLKFHDPTNPFKYEVPVPLDKPNSSASRPIYTLKYGTSSEGFFYIQVIRNSTKTVIWDTTLGGLVFSEQFLQIATRLPSSDIYGFGENRHFSFRHSMEYREWPMFSRDQSPGGQDYANLYGVHPYYTCMEDAIGNSHGVLLLNSNAQEYILHPLPSLTYRTTGGILDFYFFMGPEPETVVQQYTEVVGRPLMPPYWALGFQLSRWGYNTVDNMKAAHDRMVAAKIPYDVQFGDIDYMDERKDFTISPTNFAGLPDFVKAIHKEGMKFIIILDPGLVSNMSGYRPYELGRQNDVFIKWPQGTSPDFQDHQTDDMLGYVWPKGKTVFPDFLNPKARDVWKQLIAEQHKILEFDGLWIDMNEPSNFGTNQQRPMNWPEKDKPYWSLKCPQSKWDDPVYKPRSIIGDRLSDKTLCMVGIQSDGQRTYRHYDVHSLYGWYEMLATSEALQEVTKKRSVVISRSTFPGSGRHGSHWLGDNQSKWSHLKDSVIGILEFNLFGIPYVGADICGFQGEPDEEMCERWMQLGAFYSFSRNHNEEGTKDQDPAAFSPEVAYSSRKALETRYKLLPYLYTLFFRAYMEGSTVIRSVMHEYPHDERARALDTQFLWGPAFMIAPVLEKGYTTKDVYFPADVWYNYKTGIRVEHVGQANTVPAPRDEIPLYVRGGYILPTQQPGANTHMSQLNPMGLVIATDAAGFAQGELYLDDGESINATMDGQYWLLKMVFRENVLHVYNEHHFDNYNLPIVDTLRILGVHSAPTIIHKDAEMVSSRDYRYFSGSRVLDIFNLGLSYAANFTVTIG
ncbi:maltase-glucoamylase-like [Liolophura sinensis]|uniref:maltase-glucoamylase-like n=1 Tax=Liolophura sinensis TaxID=3198878 RepID=UPI00315846E4